LIACFLINIFAKYENPTMLSRVLRHSVDRDRGCTGSCSIDYKNYTLSELYALASNSGSPFYKL